MRAQALTAATQGYICQQESIAMLLAIIIMFDQVLCACVRQCVHSPMIRPLSSPATSSGGLRTPSNSTSSHWQPPPSVWCLSSPPAQMRALATEAPPEPWQQRHVPARSPEAVRYHAVPAQASARNFDVCVGWFACAQHAAHAFGFDCAHERAAHSHTLQRERGAPAFISAFDERHCKDTPESTKAAESFGNVCE